MATRISTLVHARFAWKNTGMEINYDPSKRADIYSIQNVLMHGWLREVHRVPFVMELFMLNRQAQMTKKQECQNRENYKMNRLSRCHDFKENCLLEGSLDKM
mmetsp:Transcript_26741/g.41001  ORF Transcript_26741/g.41001 Transcript_26741/m.41001 type:complete len:102 (+) Transcript_26741:268-573(+)